MNAIEISESFLSDIKMGRPIDEWRQAIANISDAELTVSLPHQNNRLAFWSRHFGRDSFFQDIMLQHPEWFKNKYKLFFGKHFKVANRAMSLDDIEHDMLRKSTLKWSLGYIQNPFPGKFEQSFKVFELDARIHFALNCGAVSCPPPIRFYTAANVPEQLEMATLNYLVHDTVFDDNKNEYQVTKLMNWFRWYFGGINGIKSFLKQYEIIPYTNVKIAFKPYNWKMLERHYAE
jgi:hypothetical protein